MTAPRFQRHSPAPRRAAELMRIEWIKLPGDQPQPFEIGFGYYGPDDPEPFTMCEVFATGPKEGSLMQDIIHVGCIQASMLRQAGLNFQEILKCVSGISGAGLPGPSRPGGPPLFVGQTPIVAILQAAAIMEKGENHENHN